MCKGIISAKEGNLQEAKAYFDKAEEVTDRKKDQRIKSMLYEERLLNTIDRDFSAKEKYYKKYLSLTHFRNEETKKLITQTIEKERKKTDDAQKTKIYLFSLVFILLLSIGIIVTVNKRKRKKNEQIFHEIIRNMEAEKTSVPAVQNKDEKSLPSKVKPIIKDENTEKKLLEKLNKFEKDHSYTTNSITLTKMASVLNTNTTYLTYILKTHRNSDFNSYINKKRISYIIFKIKEDPKYSTYKISYLAEECGFSTHSQFGRVFKSETGLSPSEFIAFIKKSDQ
jgi:YesN/AraC family two-component response regulator